MKLINGKLVLELKQCESCHGTLRVGDYITCTKCNGTGKVDPNKPRGKNCTCNQNGGYMRGKVHADNQRDCHCTTTSTPGQQKESICDTIPETWLQPIPVTVYRSKRPQGIGESIFGTGLYSVTDYGRWTRETDESLIADIRKNLSWVQATKVVRRDDMALCTGIGIFCNNNGYSVIATYDNAPAIQSDLQRQLTESEGMAIGQQLANEGLPGSLLVAAFRKPE